MLSAQQTRSGIPTEQQSVLPTVRGVPWWGAVLIALVPTILGAVIDGSNTDGLSTTYRILYFLGCVAAVLTVRRRSLFTAVTQPPLIAFGVALVTLYLLKADSGSGLRQFILNVMLPIAKTFPLMAWTFVVVGLLGAGRWFMTRRHAETTPKRSARHHAAAKQSRARVGTRGPEKGSAQKGSTQKGSAQKSGSGTDESTRTSARRTGSRDTTPRARRDADEPTRVTSRRRTPDRAGEAPPAEPGRAARTPAPRPPRPASPIPAPPGAAPSGPLSGHRRSETPDPRRVEAPAARRTADVPPRRREGVPPRSDGTGRRMPPRGERDLLTPRAERDAAARPDRDDPRADGPGRRRPPPRVRDDNPAPGERRDDLPPVPRARYRGVNP